MIVEPIAADEATGALESPVTRLFYNASTMICVPTSLAQEVGEALGAQAGEQRLSALLADAGFSRVRRACEGPFNMVLEARACRECGQSCRIRQPPLAFRHAKHPRHCPA